MTDCVLDQADVVETEDLGAAEATDTPDAGEVQLKRKRHTRKRGTPTKILNTPVRPATLEAIKRVAKQHNVGYGEVVDSLVKSAEEAKKGEV